MDTQTTHQRIRVRTIAIACAVILALFAGFFAFTPPAHAEGTRDLVANGGYRPYTERYNATTLGQQRLSVMHVYLEKGETVYLGTSVANAKLYNTKSGVNSGWLFSNGAMGTSYTDAQLAYVNTADVYVAQGNYANIADAIGAGKTPGKAGVTLVDLAADATDTTPGYIYDSIQEAGGVDIDGSGTGYKVTSTNTISTSTSGYVAGVKTNANSFTASSTGIYTVVFFSSAHTMENPAVKLASDTTPFAQTQKGGTIASWDISVYSGNTLQTGRVFTSTLFLNMGGNVLSGGVSKGALYSNVYAVTDDGYQYKVDFNGMDPYGFVFFANNRGLLKVDDTDSSSLYHGVRSEDNTLSDMASHGINLNATPFNTTLDKTYNLFYETPSNATLSALGIPTDPTSGVGSIKDFAFNGNGDATLNQGYVGKGGLFSFTASDDISATSYEIDLDFSATGGGTVVLSNSLVKGVTNTISWDGKDANGNVVPAGKYKTIDATLKLKGGEVHFPLLDVEQNPNGIKITRLNGTDPNSMVYFNNSASNAGSIASPWTLAKNWQVGNETDATTGVDSSNGAMAFTNMHTKDSAKGKKLLGDGDQCALDVWAYYNRSIDLGTWSFSLVDTSFTVTKAWDNTAGTPAAGNPTSVTMTLQQSSDGGTTWSNVTTSDLGAGLLNPVTYDTTTSTSHTWKGLDPTKTYRVQETSITGYATTYGTVTKGTDADGNVAFSQTVTNKYVPTKLTISKVWNHGSTEEEPQADWPTSVVIHVYTDAAKTHEITGSPFTLTSASTDESGNTWAKTITGLDPTLSYYCYEDAVTGYTSSSGGQASGSATAGYKSTFTNTFDSDTYVTAQVLKQWSGDTIDGVSYRPSSVTMTLINKDTKAKITTDGLGHDITAINPITLSDANSWYYAWPMLARTDADGNTINYNIIETTPDGYTASTDPEDPPLVFDNLTSVIWNNDYQPTSFTVTKTWENGINTSQPQTVDVQLEQSVDGGDTYSSFGDSVTLGLDGKWSYSWTGLPSYTSDDVQILYRVTETQVDNYTPAYGDVGGNATDGYTQTIANTYDYSQLTIAKTWDHGSQAEADWPASVTFQIYADGVATGDSVILTADDAAADGTWQKVVTGLPINDDAGNAITYTVKETDVTGYAQSGGAVTGDAATGFKAAFANTLQSTDITAVKTWNHAVQPQADWPTSATVHLFANGTEIGDATLNAGNSWKHTFSDEPVYDAAGKAITYTVTEDAVAGYTSTITKSGNATDGFTFTAANTFTDTTSMTLKKTWDHGDQDSSAWPASITLQLYANGDAYGDPVTITADDGWQYVWTGLLKQADGTDIAYTVDEETVDGYTMQIGEVLGSAKDGYTVTISNTYDTPALTTTKTANIAKTSDFTYQIIAAIVAIIVIALIVIIIARKRSKKHAEEALSHRKH